MRWETQPMGNDASSASALARARAGDDEAFRALTEPHRRELQVHCYRILGSLQDAEDALQETLLSAWRGLAGFEERASLRSWLYTIATNRCLNVLRDTGRRSLMPGGGPTDPPEPTRRAEPIWLQPFPDELIEGLPDRAAGPDVRYETKEAVGLAFVSGLQRMPPQQRAVLVLRDVLAFSAAETAEILDTTVDSVTSALARARGSLRADLPERSQQDVLREVGDDQVRATVAAFVAAWERSDVAAVVALLADDVEMTMPPYVEWYRGRDDVAAFLSAMPLRPGRRWRVEPAAANGQPALSFSVWDETVGAFLAHGLSVLTFGGAGGITGFTTFLDPRVVPAS
jgi:RNA polymerase sigma-70 factor, ECF subfamily